MRYHRASFAFLILSALAIAGAAHAQDAASPPSGAASAQVASAAPDPSAAAIGAPPAKVKIGRREVSALAVAMEPVTLAPNAKVDPELEQDCKFEDIVGTDVGKMLAHYRLGGRAPAGSDPRVLRIVVTDVSGASGGVYSGTKAIRIHATLLVDGRIERETDMYRYNVGGNPFRGTCHIFRQHTKRLGKDIASWLKDPGYKIEAQPMGDTDDAE